MGLNLSLSLIHQRRRNLLHLQRKYTDLVKKYNDLVANYKARGVAGDELRARLTQVEEELMEENERFQETEYRLKKANDEIEVLTAFGPRQGEEEVQLGCD